MELMLYRAYFPEGTNGELYHLGELVCYTIELPWRDNERRRSCIPEGRYRLKKRYSERCGFHLALQEVPDRSAILVHPANNALQELEGCLAPVSRLTGAGRGSQSRTALRRLMNLVETLPYKEMIYLTIKKKTT